MEIYNESVYDLFAEEAERTRDLAIRGKNIDYLELAEILAEIHYRKPLYMAAIFLIFKTISNQ